jgi:DNA-binding NtrC family response regulator
MMTDALHAIAAESDILPVARPTLCPTSRGKIVGSHPAIREIMDTISRVASSACSVLITGASGTGKELFVAALHDASPRAAQPMVIVNCGAIPENLLESELFGHARGAFTGAHAARQGLVAAAEGGTLFLDEIGELPLALQVKILRLLQQREYSPVGDSRTLKCDIRVVAATNRDLEEGIAAGSFREDLFYRLNVIHLHLPPLRDRASDIEVLAKHFFRVCAARADRTDLLGFAPETLQVLSAYSWPGNVRALENAVERAVLLANGPLILVSDLPPRVREEPTGALPVTGQALPDAGIDMRAAVGEYESQLIRQALKRTGRNKKRAADLLGVNRTTLVEMIKRKRL